MVGVRSVPARWLCILLLAGLAAGCGKKKQEAPARQEAAGSMGAAAATLPQTSQGVVARVDGSDITAFEVSGELQRLKAQLAARVRPEDQVKLEPTLTQQAIENAISRKLLLEQVAKNQITVPESDVENEFAHFRGQFPDSSVFAQQLQSANLTEKTVRDRLRENLQINKLVESHTQNVAAVTPQEMDEFYNANPEQFQAPERVRASHILVRSDSTDAPEVRRAARARADSILAAVKGGADFAQMAKRRSEDPGSAPQGGDLDYFVHGQMVPAFDAAAFSLGVGGISSVVETPYGFHIIKVTDKKPASKVSLADVRPQIEQYLQTRRRAEAMRDWVAELRAQSQVLVADSTGTLVPAPPPIMSASRDSTASAAR